MQNSTKHLKTTQSLTPQSFCDYIATNQPDYIVFDTETNGYRSAGFFYELQQAYGQPLSITVENVFNLVNPTVIKVDKYDKKGRLCKTKQRLELVNPYLTQIEPVLLKHGFVKGVRGWGVGNIKSRLSHLVGWDAVQPDKSFVGYLQFGAYYAGKKEMVYTCFPNVDKVVSRQVIEAVYNDPSPLVGKNADFDLRQIYSTFDKVLPPQSKTIYDTEQIDCLFNAHSDFFEEVNLAALCKKYEVPEEYAKCPVDPTTVYWLNPTEEAALYARNDVTSVCWIFELQKRVPEYPELKETLALESSIARILARASVEGLPLDVNVLNSMLNNYNVMLKEAFDTFIALIQPYYGDVPAPFSLPTLNLKESKELYLSFLHWLNPAAPRPETVTLKDLLENGFIDVVKQPHLYEIAKAGSNVRSIASKISECRTRFEDHCGDGKLHPEFVSVAKPKSGIKSSDKATEGGGTASGRFSTRRYSVLNRDDVNKQMVVAPEGYSIYCFDYSGVELRVAAALAPDAKMVEMFNNGLDPYREVAGRQFNIAPSDIAKKSKERTIGKTTCLACIYTGTKYTIQRQLVAGTQGELTMTLDEAQHAHDVFFDLCPGIKKHAEDSAYEAAHRGYYTTVLGRKRKFNKKALDEDKYDAVKKAWKYYTPWEVVDSNGRVSKDPLALLRYSHKSFRNVSNNHKFQGTASEALKRSLAKIPFVEYGWQMLSPTHDDIVILAPDSHREYLEYIVPKIMLEELRRILLIPPTAIPITLELEGTCGRCWASYLQDPKRYVIPKTPGYYQEPIGRWALPHDNETIIRY